MDKKILVVLVVIVLLGVLFVLSPLNPSANFIQSSNQSFKVGVLVPLTGNLSAQGQWMREGFELAKEDLEQQGVKLNLIYEDSACNPAVAVSSAHKLIDSDKLKVIVGPYCSGPVLAVAPIAESAKVILITPTASSPNIRKAGDYVFRNIVTIEQYSNDSAKFARIKFNLNSCAIINITDEYGKVFAQYFQEDFENLGGIITSLQEFDRGETDYRTQLTKIQKSSPDCVFLAGGSARENALLLKQSKELGINSVFFTEWTSEAPEFFDILGSNSGGVYLSSPFDSNSNNSILTEFQKKYFAKYGRLAEGNAAHSYDALMILGGVIKICGEDSGCIKEKLYLTINYSGVTGLTSFDSDGEVIKSTIMKVSVNGIFIPVNNS